MSKLVITLTIIGIVSALSLAFVYEWTTPMIEEHQEEARKKALGAVLPESDSFKEVEIDGITFYEGNADNEVAMIAAGGGFQGQIEMMIGFNPEERKIYAIRVLNHSETPGLGANITTEEFEKNYYNKPFGDGDFEVVKHPIESDDEVEAISGATISSEKVTNIIEEAISTLTLAYGGEV
ncbi:MAG: RnfABCDGE type electron transport complex subunit G [Halanaerobiales bacterium]